MFTDYTCYPFVDKTNIDFYLLPHADLIDEFVSNGIPKEKMIVTGIPVRSAFLEKMDKQKARKILNIDEDKKVIFIMGGSMGCVPIEKLVCCLSEKTDMDTIIFVSCGTNGKLLRSLKKLLAKNVIPFEYSSEVPRIMAASDLFITKPGGISITEAGIMGLPTLLIDAVGGCETPNYKFFIKHGYAFGANNVDSAVEKCIDILASPELLLSQSEYLHKEFF